MFYEGRKFIARLLENYIINVKTGGDTHNAKIDDNRCINLISTYVLTVNIRTLYLFTTVDSRYLEFQGTH